MRPASSGRCRRSWGGAGVAGGFSCRHTVGGGFQPEIYDAEDFPHVVSLDGEKCAGGHASHVNDKHVHAAFGGGLVDEDGDVVPVVGQHGADQCVGGDAACQV